MTFLFSKKKSPLDLVKSTQKYILELHDEKSDEKNVKKCLQKLTDNFSQMKIMLYGEPETEPKRDNIDKLCDGLLESDLLLTIVQHIAEFEFESRKDLQQVFIYVFRHRRDDCVSFVQRHPNMFEVLVTGYLNSDIALACGAIVREILRYEELCLMILGTPLFDRFFGFVQLPTFDVASDAFSTLKTILTKHKKPVAKYLETNFDDFFSRYTQLLLTDNYVTKRLALKLLAELLLCRDNFAIMMRFINIPDNLKIVMSLLKGGTNAIQLEAFHVFKIFVANPKKADAIKIVLYRNRVKLVEFLNRFQKGKADEQFNDEKGILLHTLMSMEVPPGLEEEESA